MTFKEKYQENEGHIERYTDFLLKDTYRHKQSNLVPHNLPRKSEHKLIDEIARLRNENVNIRLRAVLNPKILNDEYYQPTINCPSQLNSTAYFKPYSAKDKGLELIERQGNLLF
tara:strand:+ start:1569 stop:1910 length:342 start_codon:yes stop_codon:yes gene_type:complete